MPRYHVKLTAALRKELDSYRHGKHSPRASLVATALLMLDEAPDRPGEPMPVAKAAEALAVSDRSLNLWKKKFVEEGLEAALGRKKRERPPRAVKFDKAFQKQLIDLAFSNPPEGRTRWTVRLLAAKLVEQGIAEKISAMTVQRILKEARIDLASMTVTKRAA